MFEDGKSKKQAKKNQQARTLKHTEAHYSTQYKEQGKKLQENDSSKKKQLTKEEATNERRSNERKKKSNKLKKRQRTTNLKDIIHLLFFLSAHRTIILTRGECV